MSFHLFYGDLYYPEGGMDDYQGAFPTIEEAIAHASRQASDVSGTWAHIATLEGGQLAIVRLRKGKKWVNP